MVDILANSEAGRIAELLWQYRAKLDRMEFLLETQLLLVSAGKDDRIHHVADLLAETADALAYIDLQREVLLSEAGMPSDLTELVKRVEEPWDEVFADHQRWFSSSIGRIQELSAQNKKTIQNSQASLDSLSEMLTGQVGSSDGAYDGSGNRIMASSASATLFDGRA